jgi:CheY-like chemotaxis protein
VIPVMMVTTRAGLADQQPASAAGRRRQPGQAVQPGDAARGCALRAAEEAGDLTGLLPPTVLAIEDDLEVLGIIKAHLAGAGYRVLVAADGQTGLEMAHMQPVDLITLDLLMSPVNGRDVLHQLRADAPTRNIPVVLVTVVDRPTHDLATEGFVSKPFLGRRLLAEVRGLVPCPDRAVSSSGQV